MGRKYRLQRMDRPDEPDRGSRAYRHLFGEREKKLSASGSLAFFLMCWPAGLLVGIQFGLVRDFGFSNTAENIRLNPKIFADQYAGLIAASGWVALTCLIAVGVIVIVQRMTKKGT